MKKKSLRKKYKVKKKKSILRNTVFWNALFFFFLLFGAFFFFSFYSFFQLKKVEVLEVLEKESVWKAVEEHTKGNIGFLSSQSIFFVPLGKIREDILRDNLMLADIAVKKVFPATLRIEEKKREPVAVWCADKSRKVCFYTDEKGIAYKQAEKKINFIFIKEGVSPGKKVVMEDDLKKLFKITEKLAETEVDPGFFLLPKENEIHLVTDEGWRVYFSFYGLEDQLDYLSVVIREKIGEEERKELQYIDLRFGNKIYYK